MDVAAKDMLYNFFDAIKDDPRIGMGHVSLYTALLAHCIKNSGQNPVALSRQIIMRSAKLCSRHTYNQLINDLMAFGYIRYVPAQDLHVNSFVFFKICKMGFCNNNTGSEESGDPYWLKWCNIKFNFYGKE